MPIELPVVFSQAAAANNNHRELEENLVTRLMLDEGADVRLIGSLQNLQSSSTDQLMLEGLGGDFMLVGWDRPDASLDFLQKLGIAGRRAAHASDPQPPQESGRRIYFLDLSTHRSVTTVIDLIKKCSADRTTKTLQIGMLGGSLPISVKPSPSPAQRVNHQPSEAADPITPETPSPHVSNRAASSEEFDDWADGAMESLVDELDQMDL